MRKVFLIGLLVLFPCVLLLGETVDFYGNWGQNSLYNVVFESNNSIELVFSMHQMVVEEKEIDGVTMKSFGVPAVFIAEEGTPNLAGANRYVAIPQGAQPKVTILDSRTEILHNVEVAPSPNIPAEPEDKPLRYEKDMHIYGKDAYWPQSPVRLSRNKMMRGVDVVKVGVIPFQYNPVTKDLIVYKDIRLRIDFVGGNGHFGEDRLRSRFWEPVLQENLLNYETLPKIDFYSPERMNAKAGFEYIIIVPDDAIFEAWGDTIKVWRKLQGISCDVFTLTEVGGTSSAAIESFLNDAYNTWNPAPVAFLLLSDYPSSGKVYGITSPMWNSYCVSDNIYADVDGDDLPDMHHARITAQNNSQLSIMVNKFLNYERSPYTAANFYDNPLVACGWQDDRWFQLCSETVRHFLINALGRNPAREYKVGSGNPYVGGPWSTRQGSTPVVQYWYNMGWLPSTTNPYDYSWWNSGSAAGINAAINSGAFLVQHRDHGATNGWSEPSYTSTDLNGLNNTMFPFVFSINCLTGEYNYSSEVFSEKFHRIQYGALGVNAATQVSYSFVNDTYIWGLYDSMWPQFDTNYPDADMTGYDNLRPCMAMTSGKYYLEAAWFPDSVPGVGPYRVYTYHLFHHLSDAFVTMYSEIPQNLTVNHPPTLPTGQTYFSVTANDSSVIALSVNAEIIGVAEGTGSSINITIPAQSPPDTMKVTVTKANYYRYEADVPVVSGNSAYVVYLKSTIDDVGGGNGNGEVNPGETINLPTWVINSGSQNAINVYGLFSTSDSYTNVTQDSSFFGSVAAGDSAVGAPDYVFSVASDCPDMHNIQFDLSVSDQAGSTWVSHPAIPVYAPDLVYAGHIVDDAGSSQPNGVLDPGETADLLVTLCNEGHADASSVTATLSTSDTYITINDNLGSYGNIVVGDSVTNTSSPYNVTANASTPQGHISHFLLTIAAAGGFSDTTSFDLMIGLPGVPYADHDIGNVIYTVTDQGSCGFMADDQSQGSGFHYPNPGNQHLFIGSIWVGNSASYVVNTDYSAEGSPDWQVTANPDGQVRMGGIYYSDQDGWAMYSDVGMSAPKDITVTQDSWAWANDPYDDFIIVRYTVVNKGSSSVNGVYCGQFMDWDVGDAYNDFGGVDMTRNLAYMYGTGTKYVGVGLLDPSTASNVTLVYNPQYVWPSSYVLDSDKIQFLNGSISNHTPSPDSDWSMCVAAGPFDLSPGDTATFAVVILGGENLGDVQVNYDTAATKYPPVGVEEEPSMTNIPTIFNISSYPNPVRNSATINYQIPKKSDVSLRIYDVSGRLVDVLLNGRSEPGYYSIHLNTKRYTSGIYFYRLIAGGKEFTRKMIVVK